MGPSLERWKLCQVFCGSYSMDWFKATNLPESPIFDDKIYGSLWIFPTKSIHWGILLLEMTGVSQTSRTPLHCKSKMAWRQSTHPGFEPWAKSCLFDSCLQVCLGLDTKHDWVSGFPIPRRLCNSAARKPCSRGATQKDSAFPNLTLQRLSWHWRPGEKAPEMGDWGWDDPATSPYCCWFEYPSIHLIIILSLTWPQLGLNPSWDTPMYHDSLLQPPMIEVWITPFLQALMAKSAIVDDIISLGLVGPWPQPLPA